MSLVGFSMWLLAGLWHNLVVPAFYSRAGHGSHDGIFVLLVSYVILAGFMAYLDPARRTPDSRTCAHGLWFGALIGVLWVFPHQLAMAAAHDTSLTYVFQNAAWHAVEQGVGGVVMALCWKPSPFRRSAQSGVPRAG